MGAPVIHFDIGCRNALKTRKFYESVFGWKTKDAAFNASVDTGSKEGVNGAITALGHEPHNYVMIYMDVADINAACDKIKGAGGKISIGPVEIPGNGGWFAWFHDPEGNLLGISQKPA
ncbi:VOC family protein [Hyphococcus sp.]|uniref:VOC family protein n=1 Tax=Hyphococcus sp. TaxID=2038636 RepID=UPI003CCBD463